MAAAVLSDFAPDMADIDARVERLPVTILHAMILFACGFMFGIDLAEMAMGQALSAVFSTGPRPLAPLALSTLLASVYLGAVVGAPVMGWVADRRGLQKTLVGVTLWLGFTSLLGAACSTPGLLTLSRLLSGLALGAYPPLFIAYLSDICPSRQRGMLIFIACALAYLAPPATIFAIRALSYAPPFGFAAWRWPLGVGGILCVAGGAAFLKLPEAPRWLAARGEYMAARAVCDRFAASKVLSFFGSSQSLPPRPNPPVSAVRMASTRGRLFRVTLLYFLNPLATIAFPLITGPILLARGYNLADTLFYVGLANFGPMVGALCAGFMIDRIPRSTSLAILGVCMLAVLITFFVVPFPIAQVLTITGFGVLAAIYIPTLTTYGAELFPAARRAGSTSLAWSANRIGAALGPIILLPLARTDHVGIVGLVLGSALLASISLVCVRPLKPF